MEAALKEVYVMENNRKLILGTRVPVQGRALLSGDPVQEGDKGGAKGLNSLS